MSTNGTGPGPGATPEQLEADIARQREELAATVTQLQQKLDVKARARQEVRQLKDRARQDVRQLKDRATTTSGRPRTDLTVAAVAAVVLLTGFVVWRKRR